MNISGKDIAVEVYQDIQKHIDYLKQKGIVPKLVIVKSCDSEAVHNYISQKVERGKKIGVEVEVLNLTEDD
ncbi:MAG: bifunctional 5,10-methylene-tetrahydrofolate dehydrogenase/5,10-methylene-tetrahydrofolate cyclohydrolase, partial [Oligoflexia bacterium]|nr:bifunctional 5,10-methylene-tetrahydrofolate dehydrogenase/5,10-methylene-tetrahydrofolate cyclohydrolase [Oligoflexia bacterium]